MQREMTPAQCKAARALLGLKQQELADLARLTRSAIADFENERGTGGVIYDRIYDALTDAGIIFSPGGVRLRG